MGFTGAGVTKVFKQPGWIAKGLYSTLTKMVDSGKMTPETLKKFENALNNFASGQGVQGIKPLSGSGVKIGSQTYHYELKILGVNGGYRLYGNLGSNGQIVFSHMVKSH